MENPSWKWRVKKKMKRENCVKFIHIFLCSGVKLVLNNSKNWSFSFIQRLREHLIEMILKKITSKTSFLFSLSLSLSLAIYLSPYQSKYLYYMFFGIYFLFRLLFIGILSLPFLLRFSLSPFLLQFSFPPFPSVWLPRSSPTYPSASRNTSCICK